MQDYDSKYCITRRRTGHNSTLVPMLHASWASHTDFSGYVGSQADPDDILFAFEFSIYTYCEKYIYMIVCTML